MRIRSQLGAPVRSQVRSQLSRGAAVSGPVVPLATLPGTPLARWNANYSTATTAVGGNTYLGRLVTASRVQSLSNLASGGSHPLEEQGAGNGALWQTDGKGRRFMRFQSRELMGSGTLPGAANCTASTTVIAVARYHGPAAGAGPLNTIFGWGNRLAATQVNTLNGNMMITTSGQIPPILQAQSAPCTTLADREKTIAGSQIAVWCTNARSGGGSDVFMNSERGTAAAIGAFGGAIVGCELGRYPNSAIAGGLWASFDLYEMVVYSPALSQADAQTACDALVAAYSIPAMVNCLVTEGDSKTYGWESATNLLYRGDNFAAKLTDPGGPNALPENWRVINMAVSGNGVVNAPLLQTRRDVAGTMYEYLRPSGRNVISLEVGINDLPTQTPAATYAGLVGLINTAVLGYLQRGWEVEYFQTMCTASAPLQANVVLYRALTLLPQFLTDTLTNAGQAFDGKMRVHGLDVWESSPGVKPFELAAGAAPPNFSTDGLHPSVVGTELYAKAAKELMGLTP